MDLVTHAALGAAAAASFSPSRETRLAALAGAVAGMLPDADILISSSRDPLLNLEYHRHFTHALVFVPAGAALAAGVLRLALGARVPVRRLYAYAFSGYLLAVLLDACTSYGTHLLWPFRGGTIAWSVIAVVDPLFSLLVLVPLGFALVRARPEPARAALLLAGLVLATGVLQHRRAERVAWELAASRGHAPERLLVKPTMANLVLWRALYVEGGFVHVDAVRVGLPGHTRVYVGERAPLLEPATDTSLRPGSRVRHDVQRFLVFADGLLVRHPRRPELVGDARYSMLPTSLEPLWGIVLDPAADTVRFETGRRLTPEIRGRFLAMLLGRGDV
jgi:inner membrane protein